MRPEEEIETRLEQCLQRSAGYFAGSQNQRSEAMQEFWMSQAVIQQEIASALKWVLEEV